MRWPLTSESGVAGTVLPNALELPVAVVASRPSDHTIVQVNDAACALFRRSCEELVGARIEDLTPGPAHGDIGRHYARLGDEPLVLEKEYLRGDGTTFVGRVQALPVLGDDLAIAVVVDITDLGHAGMVDLLAPITALLDLRPRDDHEVVAAVDEVCVRVGEVLGGAVSVELGAGLVAGQRRDAAHVEVRALGHPADGRVVVATDSELTDQDLAVVDTVAAHLTAMQRVRRARADLAAAAMFEAVFDSTQIGMQLLDADGNYLRVNDAFAAMVGRSATELVGRNWREITVPDDLMLPPLLGADDAAAGRASLYDDVKRYERPDGSIVHARVSVVAVFPEGEARIDRRIHIAQVVDVTEVVEAVATERELRHEVEVRERRYRSFVEPSANLIARLRHDGRIEDVNSRFAAVLGREPAELVGMPIVEAAPERLAAVILETVESVGATGEPTEVWREWIEPANAEPGWYVLQFRPEPATADGRIEHVHLVCHEVTELVENEQRLAVMALVDPLTGLLNRAAVFDRLRHALGGLEARPGSGVAVAVIDLDQFKFLNDTHGHAIGDDALLAVSESLRSAVRTHDTVGRLGGDEFVVVFDDVADAETAGVLGERVRAALDATCVLIDGIEQTMSGSVGVAFTREQVSGDELVARADRAMYRAKGAGRGRLRFDDADDRAVLASMGARHRELAVALTRGEFELHYQPVADCRDGSVVGFEALLRWRHPERGLLATGEFLDALFTSGQIVPVGRWVVDAALRQLGEWSRHRATATLRLHVNVSPAELASAHAAAHLRSAIEGAGVDPELLRLELTEQALAGTVVSSAMLSEVASTGVGLVLDDFGTGVSSISHLRAQPLQGIKIDRSFVGACRDGERDRAIVESLVHLGRALGIEVVAEGVETQELADFLGSIGCDLHQGWHVGRPVPAEAATELVLGGS